uniref:Uncharacterized protein n=1 Tax=Siphoviridae sp. ct2u94 TaxID=2826277 RepID=A0A8S5QW17_9CAUD|nr:MAG TPA: hypothetical protein [Siphoviridae sp. ct2u94]
MRLTIKRRMALKLTVINGLKPAIIKNIVDSTSTC